MNPSYDEYADSDEDQHDAYLERMKEEGKIREENANDSSDDSGEESGGPLPAITPGTVGARGWACWVPMLVSALLKRTKRSCMLCVCFADESFNPGEEEEDVAEE